METRVVSADGAALGAGAAAARRYPQKRIARRANQGHYRKVSKSVRQFARLAVYWQGGTMRGSLAPAFVLLASLAASACGGSQSPTAPTPPISTPAPTPPAAPRANLVVADDLEFVSCVNGLCSYRGLIRNTGDACAANISGESWIVSAQGQEITRSRWSLPATVVMRPGDEVVYEGAGMSQLALNHLDGRYFASFSFDSRPCQ